MKATHRVKISDSGAALWVAATVEAVVAELDALVLRHLAGAEQQDQAEVAARHRQRGVDRTLEVRQRLTVKLGAGLARLVAARPQRSARRRAVGGIDEPREGEGNDPVADRLPAIPGRVVALGTEEARGDLAEQRAVFVGVAALENGQEHDDRHDQQRDHDDEALRLVDPADERLDDLHRRIVAGFFDPRRRPGDRPLRGAVKSREPGSPGEPGSTRLGERAVRPRGPFAHRCLVIALYRVEPYLSVHFLWTGAVAFLNAARSLEVDSCTPMPATSKFLMSCFLSARTFLRP